MTDHTTSRIDTFLRLNVVADCREQARNELLAIVAEAAMIAYWAATPEQPEIPHWPTVDHKIQCFSTY
jgi:hypothetical protein